MYFTVFVPILSSFLLFSPFTPKAALKICLVALGEKTAISLHPSASHVTRRLSSHNALLTGNEQNSESSFGCEWRSITIHGPSNYMQILLGKLWLLLLPYPRLRTPVYNIYTPPPTHTPLLYDTNVTRVFHVMMYWIGNN